MAQGREWSQGGSVEAAPEADGSSDGNNGPGGVMYRRWLTSLAGGSLRQGRVCWNRAGRPSVGGLGAAHGAGVGRRAGSKAGPHLAGVPRSRRPVPRRPSSAGPPTDGA